MREARTQGCRAPVRGDLSGQPISRRRRVHHERSAFCDVLLAIVECGERYVAEIAVESAEDRLRSALVQQRLDGCEQDVVELPRQRERILAGSLEYESVVHDQASQLRERDRGV